MTLQILVLKDRRPGHFRQSEGVVKAIARHRPVGVCEIAGLKPPPIPARLQRLLVSARVPADLLLRLWGLRLGDIAPPDLIVSAGSDTLALNAALARHFGCRNIFVGSPRGLAPELFTVALRAVPEARTMPRQLQVLKPSTVDPDTLEPPRPISSATDFPARRVALLVGGSTPRYRFAPADWTGLGALIEATAAAGLRWDITSSRRTPDAVADWLAGLAGRLGDKVDFIDFRVGKTGSIEPLFNADAILATEDSNSMVAEGVAARRPVVVLRASEPGRPEPALEALLAERHVAILRMADASAQGLVETMATVEPISRNPLDILYEALLAAGAIPQGLRADAPSPGRPV